MIRTITESINQSSFRILKYTGKRLLFAVLFVLFAISTTGVQASSSLSFEEQPPSVDTPPINEVRFDNVESFVRNDSLYIAFDLVLQGNILDSDKALHIEPVYNTVTTEIRLPKILINGKERSDYYPPEQSLLSQKEKLTSRPYFVIVRNNNETQHVAYGYVMPFVNGICKIGVLHIQQLLQDSCNLKLVEERLLPIRYISSKLNPTMFVNSVTYIISREMFDLAQSNKENDLLKIAAVYFPDDATANINASSVALTKGNVDEAWTYLSKVQDKPEAYNNLGIYYWLKGNKYKAENYFRKASKVDGQEEKANANLKMLSKYVIR